MNRSIPITAAVDNDKLYTIAISKLNESHKNPNMMLHTKKLRPMIR